MKPYDGSGPGPAAGPLEIIYQDEQLVAINKPPGLLVHRSAIDRHETRFALQLLRDQVGRRVYPVHRLDKPTSGLLLFAFDSGSAKQLSAQFASGTIRKTYLAVVRGVPADSGRIDYPLKERLDPIADAQADSNKPAQSAVTDYRRLADVELPFAVGRYATSRYSLLELKPKTGRKHQLRRHMKHIFHPIIGDTSYGEGRHNRLFRQQFNCNRLMLHAAELSLKQPKTGANLALVASSHGEFKQLVSKIFPL